MDPSAIVNMLMFDASRSNSTVYTLCKPPLITTEALCRNHIMLNALLGYTLPLYIAVKITVQYNVSNCIF